MEKKIIDGKSYISCSGPLLEKCEECEFLLDCKEGKFKWYTQLPDFIIDHYLKFISYSALKVFLYLYRKANYNPNSNHYGRCWPTDEEIYKKTGVSKDNMRKYRNELKNIGLITYKPKIIPTNNGPRTSRIYNITWMHRSKELKRIIEKKEQQLKNANQNPV